MCSDRNWWGRKRSHLAKTKAKWDSNSRSKSMTRIRSQAIGLEKDQVERQKAFSRYLDTSSQIESQPPKFNLAVEEEGAEDEEEEEEVKEVEEEMEEEDFTTPSEMAVETEEEVIDTFQ